MQHPKRRSFYPAGVMIRAGLLYSGIVFLFTIVPFFQTPYNNASTAHAESNLVSRGEYLVKAGGCNDCHTPFKMGAHGPEPDMSRMLSGHPELLKMPPPPELPNGPWVWLGSGSNTAFAGPWGITFATNLTPDKDTGIDGWKEDVFITAMKTGKHVGAGRPIMPPMPWQAYSNFSENDLKAIFAYLKSIPPIVNRVPEYMAPTEK